MSGPSHTGFRNSDHHETDYGERPRWKRQAILRNAFRPRTQENEDFLFCHDEDRWAAGRNGDSVCHCLLCSPKRRRLLRPTSTGSGSLQSCGTEQDHLVLNLIPSSPQSCLARQPINRHRQVLSKIEALELLKVRRDRIDGSELRCQHTASSLLKMVKSLRGSIRGAWSSCGQAETAAKVRTGFP